MEKTYTQKMLLNSILGISFFTLLLAYNNSYAYQIWNFSSNEEGWTGRNSTYVVQTDDNGGQLTVNTVGSDPGIVSPNLSLSSSSNTSLKMRVATFCSDTNATVYFMRLGSSTVYTGGTASYYNGGSWGTYEVDMSGNSNWIGTITQIRIDPAGSCGSPESTGFIAFDWIEVSERPNSPPTISMSLDNYQMTYGWNNGVTVSSIDPDGDTYSCSYKVDSSGTWYSTSINGWTLIPASRFSIDSNSVYVRCTDSLGGVREVHKIVTMMQKPEGTFDAADCISIRGWARDPDTTSSIDVRIYSDGDSNSGTLSGTYSADIYRSDLGGNYGFNVSTPISLKDGASHQLYVYAVDTDDGSLTNLDASPKSITCVIDESPNFSPTPTLQNSVKLTDAPIYFTGTGRDDIGLKNVRMIVSGPRGNNIEAFPADTVSGTSVLLSSYYFDPGNTTYAGLAGIYTVQLIITDTLDQTATATFTVSVSQLPEGTLDAADCTSIRGWARDPDTTSSIDVRIYTDGDLNSGTLIGTYTADIYRSDLGGNYGFNVSTPISLKDGTTHQLDVYAVDSDDGSLTNLDVSPTSITCVTDFDLTVSLQALPVDIIDRNAQQGSTFPITCTVTSAGGLLQSETDFVRIYVYMNQSPDPTSALPEHLVQGDIGTTFDFQVSLLDDGTETNSTPFNIPIPTTIEGPHYIHVKVDGPEYWAESNETNNWATSSDTIAIWRNEIPSTLSDNGILARTWENPEVYWISKYGKKWLLTGTLQQLGYSDGDIGWYGIRALDSLTFGEDVISISGSFCYRSQSDSSVYKIMNGASYPFINWDSFLEQGFTGEDIYWAPPTGFDWIQSLYPLINAPMIRVEPQSIHFQ